MPVPVCHSHLQSGHLTQPRCWPSFPVPSLVRRPKSPQRPATRRPLQPASTMVRVPGYVPPGFPSGGTPTDPKPGFQGFNAVPAPPRLPHCPPDVERIKGNAELQWWVCNVCGKRTRQTRRHQEAVMWYYQLPACEATSTVIHYGYAALNPVPDPYYPGYGPGVPAGPWAGSPGPSMERPPTTPTTPMPAPGTPHAGRDASFLLTAPPGRERSWQPPPPGPTLPTVGGLPHPDSPRWRAAGVSAQALQRELQMALYRMMPVHSPGPSASGPAPSTPAPPSRGAPTTEPHVEPSPTSPPPPRRTRPNGTGGPAEENLEGLLDQWTDQIRFLLRNQGVRTTRQRSEHQPDTPMDLSNVTCPTQ